MMRPDLSTRVRGFLFTVPHPTLGAETQTPPAHLYANTRRHTGTELPAEKHVHANTYTACAAGPVCARSGRRTGDFVKCIQQTF